MRNLCRVLMSVALGGLVGCSEPTPTISGTKYVPPEVPSQPTETEVIGPGLRSATFVAGDPTQKLDLLFVVDDSGSMTGEIDTVIAQFQTFLGTLQSRRDVDYRIAAASTNATLDQGALYTTQSNAKYVARSAANPVSEFTSIMNKIRQNTFNYGSRPYSGWEMGLYAAELALTNHGSHLLRPGVPLAVVPVSDAPDMSRTCGNGINCGSAAPHSVSRYVDFFKSLKTTTNVPVKVLYYPLSARWQVECSSLEDSSSDWNQLGDRYYQVHQGLQTGFFGSICSGLLPHYLNEIARRISSRGICYDLAGTPTRILSVTVDGVSVTQDELTGYQFEAGTGSICFAGDFQPASGTPIRVQYESP